MRQQLKDRYSEMGRPSIDPELLLRILLIGYLYGITSDFFAFGIEFEMLTRVKCPLHGERFTPRFHIYVAKWLRAKQPQLIWTHHS